MRRYYDNNNELAWVAPGSVHLFETIGVMKFDMLFRAYSYQIFNTVIRLITIDMMYMPCLNNRTVYRLPDKNVFFYIILRIARAGTWMIRGVNTYIAIISNIPATFPVRAIWTGHKIFNIYMSAFKASYMMSRYFNIAIGAVVNFNPVVFFSPITPPQFDRTRFTSKNIRLSGNGSPTINTKFRFPHLTLCAPCQFKRARHTSLNSQVAQLPTINTRVPVPLTVFQRVFASFIHINIIP